MAIYFNPTQIKESSDFVKIENHNFKDYLKTNLNLTNFDFKTHNPIVFGSVVGSWDRKLKMLDASFFTFFSAAE